MKFLLDDQIFTHAAPAPGLPALRVVLTRFNMVIDTFREVGKLVDPAVFDDWLKRRCDLFQNISLPSVVQQTQRPDLWIIGFDSERRDAVAQVLSIISPFDWIIPAWQRAVEGVHEGARTTFVRTITENLSEDYEFVISSRVDNDDALARGFCESVFRYAAAVGPPDDSSPAGYWISFPYGLQYAQGRTRVLPLPNNAFLSRVERAARFRSGRGGSAMQGNHSHIFQKWKVYTPIARYPMWLQVIHSGNVLNAENSSLLELAEPARTLARMFSIKESRLQALTR